jgi:SNF2 family DNA or RNA helicase
MTASLFDEHDLPLPDDHPRAMTEQQYFESLAMSLLPDHLKPLRVDHYNNVAVWCLIQADNQWYLAPAQCRMLKDGGLSPKHIKFVRDYLRWQSDYARPYGYTDESDTQIVTLLAQAPQIQAPMRASLLEGQKGHQVLQLLLGSERFFWYDAGALYPVFAGKRLVLEAQWQQNDQQQWALTTTPLNERYTQLPLICTEPGFAVTMHQSTPQERYLLLHPLIAPLPLRSMQQLDQPFWLAQKDLYEAWSHLYALSPDLPRMPTELYEAIAPEKQPTLQFDATPSLTLFVEESYYLAKLSFEYGPYRVLASEEEMHQGWNLVTTPAGQLSKLIRQFAQEQTAIERLELEFLAAYRTPEHGLIMVPGDCQHLPSFYDWLNYLDLFTQLESEGWIVELNAPKLAQLVHQPPAQVAMTLEDDDDDFTLSAQIKTDQGSYPLLPLLLNLLEREEQLDETKHYYLSTEEGDILRVEGNQLLPVLNHLNELFDRPMNAEGKLRLNRFDAMGLMTKDAKLHTLGQSVASLERFVQQLTTRLEIPRQTPPTALQATLRPYQAEGVDWLCFLTQHRLGGILADDMGLGKTLQVIGYLLKQQELGLLTEPTLIVCPTSVVGNWMAEFAKFAPSLPCLRYEGSDRRALVGQLERHSVLVSSYAIVQRDAHEWTDVTFSHVILDEAQYIKNPLSKTAQVVREIPTQQRFCLTGTPLENHHGELWSLFDFIMPSYLGSAEQFKKRYRRGIEQLADRAMQVRLTQRVTPFMLRRTKTQVAQELPPKTEIIHRVSFSMGQEQLYNSVRLAMEKRVQDLMAQKGLKRSKIEILDALLKLRQVCCDPRLLKIAQADKVRASAKLDALLDMVMELLEEERNILIFSQFAEMLGLIEQSLMAKKIPVAKLTGATRAREKEIAKFTQGEVRVFLISLKAGGVGLNLTQADTVIHYDPWWNPAAEQQATDRAYRIGQDKPVFVYKLIVEGSVEEKILHMQAHKQALSEAIFSGNDSLGAWSDTETILSLFQGD